MNKVRGPFPRFNPIRPITMTPPISRSSSAQQSMASSASKDNREPAHRYLRPTGTAALRNATNVHHNRPRRSGYHVTRHHRNLPIMAELDDTDLDPVWHDLDRYVPRASTSSKSRVKDVDVTLEILCRVNSQVTDDHVVLLDRYSSWVGMALK